MILKVLEPGNWNRTYSVVYVIAMATLYNDIKKKYYINISKKLRESTEDSGF